MSHLKERKEKTCLNCQASLYGRYCHVCGQENLEPKESFWHLVSHFFNDVTHFDGKFFSSVKYLLRRPGFLALEYIRGRRASYLNPIRLYVFTSALFFILLAVLKKPEEIVRIEDRSSPDARKYFGRSFFGLHPEAFDRVGEYDSSQLVLPESKRDGWFKKKIMRRLIANHVEFEADPRHFREQIYEHIFHSLPKVFFISLPLFAMILNVLYSRHQQYFYTDHGIFTIYFYCATFLLMLLSMLVGRLDLLIGWKVFHWAATLLDFAITLYILFYLYRAMLVFYGQSRGKTLLKWVITFIAAIFVNIILLASLMISVITIA